MIVKQHQRLPFLYCRCRAVSTSRGIPRTHCENICDPRFSLWTKCLLKEVLDHSFQSRSLLFGPDRCSVLATRIYVTEEKAKLQDPPTVWRLRVIKVTDALMQQFNASYVIGCSESPCFQSHVKVSSSLWNFTKLPRTKRYNVTSFTVFANPTIHYLHSLICRERIRICFGLKIYSNVILRGL